MINNIASYATLVFDCDGVILNSNKVKTRAFYLATLPYGERAAREMVSYHVENGGVSRYKKLSYFLENIVLTHAQGIQGPNLQELLEAYAMYVREGLASCEIAPGLNELRMQAVGARWLVVSGGDQTELRTAFRQRGIDKLFDGGIFGSPDTKEYILAREISSNNLKLPALFLGDSKYDYQAAFSNDLDFCFLSNWTEVAGWQEWSRLNCIPTVSSIQAIVDEN